MNITLLWTALPAPWMTTACDSNTTKNHDRFAAANKVFERVSTHDFHPLNADWSMTKDRRLEKDGIADLRDNDWRVRPKNYYERIWSSTNRHSTLPVKEILLLISYCKTPRVRNVN